MSDQGDAIRKAYYEAHAVCPSCGSEYLFQTLLGFVLDLDHPDAFKDRNEATCCDCRWKGVVDDLKAKLTAPPASFEWSGSADTSDQ